jgi:flagellar motility protein MotE (MotC chaperone)
MQELLESRGYETIFFKSWEYGNEEKPWIPFMIKVVDELFKDAIDKKELIRNIFLFSTDVVLQTYTQGKISAGGILNVYKGSRKASPFKQWSNEDAKTVIERVTKIEEFKKRIKERAEKSLRGKIVIFIDDLDRIPEKIVDFLNSLKTFLDISGCIFILGCDYKILDSALKQRYEGEIYEDYFDKIVQTEFYIPKISEHAIKAYLQFLTGWDAREIDECKRLVIHSIGGNPRKIKRVVNATMLTKSVFEKRLATFLQAFERPKPEIQIDRKGVKKERGEFEEPITLKSEITKIFTPAKVFDLLFDKKVLFKLVCMREQWFTYYEKILIDEEKQQDLISLQDPDIKTGISELHNTTKEERDELKENIENLPIFINDPPTFQGVMDLETYLTLLEISSPEAGISMEYPEPEKLPINLFNRYMLFERINKGEVDKSDIEKKIKQMDWESKLCYYPLFTGIISALGYGNLLKGLFEKNQMLEKIKVDPDPEATGRLLESVRKIDKKTARGFLNETEPYMDKIEKSQDLGAIRWLLDSVRKIDKKTARGLLNETEPYMDKIEKSQKPGAIGMLLDSVRKIDGEIARKLLGKTKDTYADKIEKSQDPYSTKRLLDIVSKMDKKAARGLLNETKDTYAEKIIVSTDPWAIGWLLKSVRELNKENFIGYKKAARRLLNETKGTYTNKIEKSQDPGAIGWLLLQVSFIDKKAARGLVNEIKDTYVEKIIASTDPGAIGWLLRGVSFIDKKAARGLLNETKGTYTNKIEKSQDPGAIGILLDIVSEMDKKAARGLLNETKDAYAGKIIARTDPGAIGWLLLIVRKIDEETARELLNKTKDTYAEKIIDSMALSATGWLLKSVRWIDEETARGLLKETKDTFAEKINACTDLSAIGVLLRSVRRIDKETARGLLEETRDTFAEKRRVSINLNAIFGDRVSEISEELANWLKKATKNILIFFTKRF